MENTWGIFHDVVLVVQGCERDRVRVSLWRALHWGELVRGQVAAMVAHLQGLLQGDVPLKSRLDDGTSLLSA